MRGSWCTRATWWPRDMTTVLWGEWSDALGFISATVPSIPVPGNHDLHRPAVRRKPRRRWRPRGPGGGISPCRPTGRTSPRCRGSRIMWIIRVSGSSPWMSMRSPRRASTRRPKARHREGSGVAHQGVERQPQPVDDRDAAPGHLCDYFRPRVCRHAGRPGAAYTRSTTWIWSCRDTTTFMPERTRYRRTAL